jgi:hypothetical protein
MILILNLVGAVDYEPVHSMLVRPKVVCQLFIFANSHGFLSTGYELKTSP